MPPIPVISDVFRVTINFRTYAGITPRNVLHFGAPLLDGDGLAEALNDNWLGQMCDCMKNDFEPATFDILPLDGSTPTSTYDWDGPSDFCNGDPEPVPEQAAVVSLKTAQRGPRGRGRIYIGPCGEGNVDAGILDEGTRGNMQTQWAQFAANVLSDGAGLVVASYTHEDKHVVNNLSISQHVGTQRRRLLQTRA